MKHILTIIAALFALTSTAQTRKVFDLGAVERFAVAVGCVL